MAKVAGAGSITCSVCLLAALAIAPMVVMMHKEKQKVCLSFRRATLARMFATSAAGN